MVDVVDAQVGHATHVKEHAIASMYKTKDYLLTSGAPRDKAGTLGVQMRLGNVLGRAAVRTLYICSRNVHREDVAQFTRSSVTVKIVVRI